MLAFALVVAPILIMVGAVKYVSAAADTHDATPTDAIVVLGAAQYDGRPSPVLEARLQHAKRLVDAGVADRVITVGGKQTGDRFTEAEVGKSWLVDAGLSDEQVYAVPEGRNTIDSLTAVASLAAANQWSSVTIDSDPAHMARSVAIARRLGFDAHPNPNPDGDGSQVTDEYLMRETTGYLLFQLHDQWSVPRLVRQ